MSFTKLHKVCNTYHYADQPTRKNPILQKHSRNLRGVGATVAGLEITLHSSTYYKADSRNTLIRDFMSDLGALAYNYLVGNNQAELQITSQKCEQLIQVFACLSSALVREYHFKMRQQAIVRIDTKLLYKPLPRSWLHKCSPARPEQRFCAEVLSVVDDFNAALKEALKPQSKKPQPSEPIPEKSTDSLSSMCSPA